MLSVLLKNMHIEPLRMTVTAWVLGLIGLGGSAPLRAVDFTVVVENPLGHKWPHELLTLPLTAAQHETMQRMDAQTHALVVTCNGFTVPAQLHAGPGGQPLMSWLVRDRVTSKQGHEQFAFHVQAVEKNRSSLTVICRQFLYVMTMVTTSICCGTALQNSLSRMPKL